MIEMKASDYEKAIDEAWKHGANHFYPKWIKDRAREIAAARISRAEFERDRMGETGERNAAARQASEPARGEVMEIPDHASIASYRAQEDGSFQFGIADNIPRVMEWTPLYNKAAIAAAFPALVAERDRLANDLADALDLKNGCGPTVLTALVADRDRLAAEVESWKKLAEVKQRSADESCVEVERLAAEVAELRKDADRYRWLRERITVTEVQNLLAVTDSKLEAYEVEIDKAIDAAKRGEK